MDRNLSTMNILIIVFIGLRLDRVVCQGIEPALTVALTPQAVETNVINDVIAEDTNVDKINEGFISGTANRIPENEVFVETQIFKDTETTATTLTTGNYVVAEEIRSDTADRNNILAVLTTTKTEAAPIGNEVVAEETYSISGDNENKTADISTIYGNEVPDLGSGDRKSTEAITTSTPTVPTTTLTVPTTTLKDKMVTKPKKKVKDKWTIIAECCWELRLKYYWECDLYLKKCCLESNLTEYRPICASTGPGYIYWWKPYRRIFYNDCAAMKYLCESLPPLTAPWKCMWRRDDDHPHCKGKKNVMREKEPPVLDCSRYGLSDTSNHIQPAEKKTINFYKHGQDENAPNWMQPYPDITLSTCGNVQKPTPPAPVLLFLPTTESPPVRLTTPVRFQELRARTKPDLKKKKETKTTQSPTTALPATTTSDTTTSDISTTITSTEITSIVYTFKGTTLSPFQPAKFEPPLMEIKDNTLSPFQPGTFEPPLMEVRSPVESEQMSLLMILFGVFTVIFIAGCFIFSLWLGSISNTDENRALTQPS